MAYESTFASLENLGVFDVILPFILIFTIIFAVLQKVKIFGDKSKQFNTVISLVMAASAIYPHVAGLYPPDRDIVNIINTSLPQVSVVIVAIVMGLIIVGVFGKRWEIGGNSLSGWVALLAFGAVLYIFGNAANWWQAPAFLRFLDNPDTIALIITILVFAIIIWLITKEDAPPGQAGVFARIGDQFNQNLK